MSKTGLAWLTGLGIGTAAIATAVMTLAPEAIFTAVVSDNFTSHDMMSHRLNQGIFRYRRCRRVGVQEEIE